MLNRKCLHERFLRWTKNIQRCSRRSPRGRRAHTCLAMTHLTLINHPLPHVCRAILFAHIMFHSGRTYFFTLHARLYALRHIICMCDEYAFLPFKTDVCLTYIWPWLSHATFLRTNVFFFFRVVIIVRIVKSHRSRRRRFSCKRVDYRLGGGYKTSRLLVRRGSMAFRYQTCLIFHRTRISLFRLVRFADENRARMWTFQGVRR